MQRGLRAVVLRSEGHPRRQGGGGAGDGALHNAAENMVGGEGAGESVCLRGRSTDPCLRGAQRSLIKKFLIPTAINRPFRALHG